MSYNARISGTVEYRQGDGVPIVIRKGPCEIEQTAMDVTLSWTDGKTNGSTAMPLANFRRYVASKAIEVLDAAPA
jgi:hypothetical protein